MKPFDLEAALNGAAVVTRDGRKVTQLKVFNVASNTQTLIGVIHYEGEKYSYWLGPISGKAGMNRKCDDLFMYKEALDVKSVIEKAARIVDEMAEEAESSYEPSYQVEYYREAAAKIRAIVAQVRDDPKPFQRLSEGEIINCMAETITLDDLAFARAIEDALEAKNK